MCNVTPGAADARFSTPGSLSITGRSKQLRPAEGAVPVEQMDCGTSVPHTCELADQCGRWTWCYI